MAYVLSSYTQELTSDKQKLLTFAYKLQTRGNELYRDLPWRRTQDPYEIWLSEVMLQQTQVARVDGRWQRWLMRFPTVSALANASTAEVLDEWQGMGYNRRALALRNAAIQIVEAGGELPKTAEELVRLPGIGPATAAGICAFAYNEHSVYLETNVRTVLLDMLYPDKDKVDDRELLAVVDATCPASGDSYITVDGKRVRTSPRSWYYALLDVGAQIKATGINPSRRSRQHTKQSKFEGSYRQKRAELVRILLDAKPGAISLDDARAKLNAKELAAGREEVSTELVQKLLKDLTKEGFCSQIGQMWQI